MIQGLNYDDSVMLASLAILISCYAWLQMTKTLAKDENYAQDYVKDELCHDVDEGYVDLLSDYDDYEDSMCCLSDTELLDERAFLYPDN